MPSLDRRSFLQRSAALVGSTSLLPWARVTGAQTTASASGEPRYAQGVVFHDRKGDGIYTAGDPGIAGVCVSNGRDVVRTDAQGRYRLPVGDHSVIFVIKPSGWMCSVDALNLPRFYYMHRPTGSPDYKYAGFTPTGDLPEAINFPLVPNREPNKFRVVLFGDPQPRNIAEIGYIAHDVVEELVGVDAAFGISLGDIMFNDLSIYDDLKEVVAAVGLPWYHVKGNHDMNYDSKNTELSAETFQRHYGPRYYSLNYGKAHFIVLDDVAWSGSRKTGYHGGLGDEQLEFVKNDLALVPKDHLVVVSMHIPIVEVEDRHKLFDLLADRPYTLSISAHTHVHEDFFLGKEEGWKGAKPHHHLNQATVCGSWWEGAPDEKGIPHATMSDGGPNGYSFLNIDGARYTVEFKAARRDPRDQMAIHTPVSVSVGEAAATEVVVNVYAGSERNRVEMRFGKGGKWQPMERVVRADPYYLALKDQEAGPNPPPGLKLPEPTKTPHIWVAKLPGSPAPGTHLLQVRTVDMYGQAYEAQRLIRVV